MKNSFKGVQKKGRLGCECFSRTELAKYSALIVRDQLASIQFRQIHRVHII